MPMAKVSDSDRGDAIKTPVVAAHVYGIVHAVLTRWGDYELIEIEMVVARTPIKRGGDQSRIS